MTEKERSLVGDLYIFLKILAENSRGVIERESDEKNHIKRSEKELAKVFGKERLESLIDLCFEQGYIRRERVKGISGIKGFEEDFYSIKIQGKGLKYLEEFEREEVKEKHSRWMLIANVILMLATIGLLVTTWISYNIADKSFESENRPYIYIKNVGAERLGLNNSIFNVEIENFGNFPGRLQEIIITPNCGLKYSLGGFPRNTVLKKDENIMANINEHGGCGNELDMVIEIKYTGVGELKDEFYNYIASMDVNKEQMAINLHEGTI